MKKYLVGLVIVFSFFIFDLSAAQATKCCCYLEVADAERESFAVTQESTYLIDNATSETNCVNSCFNIFTNEYRKSPNRLFVDYYNRYTWDLISEENVNKDLCFDRFSAGKPSTTVDYDEYLGCAVYNTSTPHRLIYIASPGKFSKYDKEIVVEGPLDVSDEKREFLNVELNNATSFTEVSKIWEEYLKYNITFNSENYSLVEYADYLYSSLLEFEPQSSCGSAYSVVKDEFTRFPNKDILIIKTSDGTVIENELTINAGQKIDLFVNSSFGIQIPINYNWVTSSGSIVSFFTDDGHIVTSDGFHVIVEGGLSGGAVITVESDWGGKQSITIKNVGLGISDTVLKIKNKCLELVETANNNNEDLMNSCNDIGAGTTEATALLKCKEAAVAVDNEALKPDREAQCDSLITNQPVTGGEEGTGNALYNSMVDQIKRFSSSGLVGTDKSVPLIIGSLLKYVFGIVGSVAFAIFIYGGLSYMFSGGDKKKLSAAKDTFLWAALGLVAIFLSYSILNFVISKL